MLRRILAGVAVCGVLSVGAVQISAAVDRAQIGKTLGEIERINANVMNLEMCLENCHDLSAIERAARKLGFEKASAEQIRTVVLQDNRTAAEWQNVHAAAEMEQKG